MAAILNGLRNLFVPQEEKQEGARMCLDVLKLSMRIAAVALIAFAIFCHTIPAWLIFLPVAYLFIEISVITQSVQDLQEKALADPARVSKKEFGEEIFRYAPIFYPLHRACLKIPGYSRAWDRLYVEYRNCKIED